MNKTAFFSFRRLLLGTHPASLISLFLSALITVLAIAQPEAFTRQINQWSNAFNQNYGSAVIVITSLLLILCLAVAFSPLGRLRLGGAEERPEFSTLSWFTMLFAAGMGAGLLYWGVAEPLTHVANPPPSALDDALGHERAAMVICYLHWALHPWGIYAAGSLCVAWFAFRRQVPMLPSEPFRDMLHGRNRLRHAATVTDILAVIALTLGLAAAMTQGTMQIYSGLARLGVTTAHPQTGYLMIVAALATVYLFSAATELRRGIQWLSNINILIAVLLIAFLLVLGPVTKIFSVFAQSLADYLRYLPELSFGRLDAGSDESWSSTWTVTYFLSWYAWLPFVAVFIARISRGRTLREFLLGVLLLPSLFTFLWFSVMGANAFDALANGTLELDDALGNDASSALFSLLHLFPATEVMIVFSIAIAFCFLVTSADSASYVLGMIAMRGEANPPMSIKLFWGVVLALLTAALVLSEQGVLAVRSIFSFAAIPVLLVTLGQVGCFLWSLRGKSKS